MKKIKISVAALMIAGGSLLFSSCIGSFALTKEVLDWNMGVGKKFVNEVVFVAFWILPVYEVTALTDILVLNSIEFWKNKKEGSTASTKTIETDHGKYLIVPDSDGYTITHMESGQQTRLNFEAETATWAVEHDGENMPFMTYVDSEHVKMITPEGDFRLVELSESGVMAYQALAIGSEGVFTAQK